MIHAVLLLALKQIFTTTKNSFTDDAMVRAENNVKKTIAVRLRYKGPKKTKKITLHSLVCKTIKKAAPTGFEPVFQP